MNTVSVHYGDKMIRLVLVWVTQANQTQRLFEVICEGYSCHISCDPASHRESHLGFSLVADGVTYSAKYVHVKTLESSFSLQHIKYEIILYNTTNNHY